MRARVPAPLKSEYPIELIKGYLFREDATTPELVDVEVEKRPDEPGDLGERAYDSPDAGILNLFQISDSEFPLSSSTFASSRNDPSQLIVYYADDFLMGDYMLNRCVVELTKGKASHPWAGPMLLMKLSPHSDDRFKDVDAKGLASAVKFLSTYGD